MDLDGARCCRRRSTTVSPKCAREPPLLSSPAVAAAGHLLQCRSGGCTPRLAHAALSAPNVCCTALLCCVVARAVPYHTRLYLSGRRHATMHDAPHTPLLCFALLCFDSHPRPRAKEGAAAGIAARVPTPTSTCALASLRSLFIVLLTASARRHISAARARNEPASLIRCVPPKWR